MTPRRSDVPSCPSFVSVCYRRPAYLNFGDTGDAFKSEVGLHGVGSPGMRPVVATGMGGSDNYMADDMAARLRGGGHYDADCDTSDSDSETSSLSDWNEDCWPHHWGADAVLRLRGGGRGYDSLTGVGTSGERPGSPGALRLRGGSGLMPRDKSRGAAGPVSSVGGAAGPSAQATALGPPSFR